MKRRTASLFSMSCLLAAPLLAQTTIGGGTCSSASLSGVYAVSITARQVTASGTFTGVFQSNGWADFDGLSAVTISLVADTGQAVATPVTWSGTYSVQANCAAVINIATGGSATLNLAVYDQGKDFALSGSDTNYTYSGNGNTQPAGCSASTFSGVYTFTGTGFALTGSAPSGIENGTGLLQFDGVSSVTVNLTMSATGAVPSALTLTGSYSISSNCLGSATLTDASANSYVMSFSIYNSSVANASSYVGLAQSSKFLVTGNAHAVYGQPAASAAAQRPGNGPALGMVVKPLSGSAGRGGRA
ncbi:MAG: hypothetical protein ABSH00_03345 [Bryobacteraceae bacterium]|jgi:hypothetical protein